MPKISIITPFYKGNRFLPALFEVVRKNQKVLQEKYPDSFVELILVNDSPQQEIHLPAEMDDLNYKVIVQPQNMGIHKARVTGLNQAGGEYILFLDQDDELEDDCLLEQYKTIGLNDVVIANAKIEQADGTQTLLYRSEYEFQKVLNKEFYLKAHNMIASPGQCLIRKDAIPQGWCENIMKVNGSDDLFLWLFMFAQKKKMCLNRRVVYIHKYTGENLSASAEKMNRSSLEIVENMCRSEAFDKRDIRVLKKSREFARDFRRAGAAKKILLLFPNLDVFCPRVYWKIRTVLSLRAGRTKK